MRHLRQLRVTEGYHHLLAITQRRYHLERQKKVSPRDGFSARVSRSRVRARLCSRAHLLLVGLFCGTCVNLARSARLFSLAHSHPFSLSHCLATKIWLRARARTLRDRACHRGGSSLSLSLSLSSLECVIASSSPLCSFLAATSHLVVLLLSFLSSLLLLLLLLLSFI